MLLHYFAFLPAQVLAMTLAAFDRWPSVSCTAVATDFHVQPVLLCKSLLKRVSYRHINVNL